MKKLICLRGLPASGKSTWAKEQGTIAVLNKDSIREVLHNWVYSKENEKEVVEFERKEVEKSLEIGMELVIVDNTHLWIVNKHINYYRELAKKYNYEFEIKDFYVSREEAIKRDSTRAAPVWVEVIDRMIKMSANAWYPTNPIFKEHDDLFTDAIIVDIDGTLAFMDEKRTPYEYNKVDGDRANPHLINLLVSLHPANDIIVISWRDTECREETLKWLKDNNVPFNKLYMRAEGDTRKDAIVKEELYRKHVEPYFNVTAVFDDRNQVVDMWRLKLHLPTYQCWYGNF